MSEKQLLARITVNPGIFGGKPIIRGMRFAVEHLLGYMGAGHTPEYLLEQFPFLEKEDIQACLLYAARVVGNEQVEEAFVGAAPQ